MSPEELVDQHTTPGANYVYGTDGGGYKDWIPLSSLVAGIAPTEKEFPIPLQTWTWTHNLGYRPVVQVLSTDREVMLSYVKHNSINELVVEHVFAATGWVVVR